MSAPSNDNTTHAVGEASSVRARLWDAGYRPIALKTGDKMPVANGWPERARRDPPADAEDAPTSNALNTGILCDGLRVLDFDVEETEAVRRLRALAFSILGETPCTRTRSNSPRAALLYRAADGAPPKRTMNGTVGKVEVLGYGNQLHAYGPHPSGAALIWDAPPHETPVDQLPAVTEAQITALLAAAAPLIDAATAPAKSRTKTEEKHQQSVHGLAADRLDVAAALAAIPNSGVKNWDEWNRVGLAVYAATSGSEVGRDAWHAWSSRNPSYDQGETEARWDHYAAHKERKLPPGIVPIGAGSLFQMAAEAQPGWTKPSQKSKPPVPKAPAMSILTRSACPPPALPLAVFGPFWSDLIMRAAEGANAPPDFVALPLLSIAASLLGNARWVVAWPGWAEPPVLWCASVGNPSSGKSSGASPVVRDIIGKVEKHICRNYAADLTTYESVASVARAILKKWEKETAKAVEAKQPTPERPAEATIPPKPIRPRARVADVTVEKLAEILGGLPKGVLYVRDELAGWLLNLSRYANGGSDRPFWLEAYNGGAHMVDRVKNPDPIFIPHLSVPLFGTIQPDRLADVLKGADDGLPSRFLWAWPEAKPFVQPKVTADIDAAASRLMALADLDLAKGEDGEQMPVYVHLAPDARELLAAFCRDMQDRENTAHGLLKSSLGKARGQALRLALVLEYLWWCGDGASSAMPGAGVIRTEPQTVSLRAMQAATGMMDAYFLPMAARVLGDAAVPVDERNARTLATWIFETKPELVNVSSIRDDARLPGLRESDPVKAACRFLVEANWLLPPPPADARGRPRGDFTVNPLIWETGK